MCIGLMFSESEFRCGDPGSISGRGVYELTFQYFEGSNEEIMATESWSPGFSTFPQLFTWFRQRRGSKANVPGWILGSAFTLAPLPDVSRPARIWLILNLTRSRCPDSENQDTLDDSLQWRYLLLELQKLSGGLNSPSPPCAIYFPCWQSIHYIFTTPQGLMSRFIFIYAPQILHHFHFISNPISTLFFVSFSFTKLLSLS